MRRLHLALAVVLTIACVTAAQADLLWDNFLTDDPRVDGGFDGHSYFSSENNAAVEDTWATDDVFFNHDVTIQGIKWAGGRDPNWDYTVEVIILEDSPADSTFNELPGFPLAVQDYQVLDTFGTFYGLEVYNGYVELPDTELPAGHYYIGVRLVSGDGLGDGRNVALTTGDGFINGDNMGLVRPGPAAYYDWMFIEDFPGETATDYAFQVYGVPEPAAIVLLAAGFLVLRRP